MAGLKDIRDGIFDGDDPIAIARRWLAEAEKTEAVDPNAMALSTVDAQGCPNVRIVLLKQIEANGFTFFTNYESAKGQELEAAGHAAFVLHWKSLGRQIRVRGSVERATAQISDAYYNSRDLDSRLGAWASRQSRPLSSRAVLMDRVEEMRSAKGERPDRPEHWGGYTITPVEIEFWADGAYRLHDRFVWRRKTAENEWEISRLYP
ncbi:MAG: pyridoxamine 5'-phosphate oxidase [Pseudomonadota bacterium]